MSNGVKLIPHSDRSFSSTCLLGPVRDFTGDDENPLVGDKDGDIPLTGLDDERILVGLERISVEPRVGDKDRAGNTGGMENTEEEDVARGDGNP